MKQNQGRKIYLDILRIIAIFLVLFTHSGEDGNKLYRIVSERRLQIAYIMLDCFRTINNLILFMISGALLLGKNEGIVTIWRKRILRFLICLLFFSYVQVIWEYYSSSDIIGINIWETFKALINKPVWFSYWYLYRYICFLVMLPFLRNIAQKMNDSQFWYLLAVSIITLDLFPLMALSLGISKINFNIFGTFLDPLIVLYPLLGYYLEHYSEKLIKKWMYPVMGILSIGGVCIAVYMTIWNYEKNGKWEENYISLFNTITAVAVFFSVKKIVVWLEGRNLMKLKIVEIIQFASSTMFGIFLLENILKTFTKPVFNILSQYIPRIFACGIWLIVTMLFGNIIVGLLKRIPGVKRIL